MSEFKFTEEDRYAIIKALYNYVGDDYDRDEHGNAAIKLDSQDIQFLARIERIISEREQDGTFVYWQKCPKCDGQGTVCKPPWIAGDVYEWSSTASQHQCNVCNGAMIIPSPPNPNK